MLQPSQVGEVSSRYAAEIAEVRDFLVKAGFPAGNARALGVLVRRLREDRSFHRDLSSHVWVVVHNRGEAIRYSDLLGVFAIAAAGPQHATAAEEDEAHELLRFLMEARDSMTAPVKERPATSTPRAGMAAGPVVPSRLTEAPGTPLRPVAPQPSDGEIEASARPAPAVPSPATPPELTDDEYLQPEFPIRIPRVETESEEEHRGARRRLGWIAAAVVCLLAVAAGWWFYRGSAKNNIATAPAPVVEGNAASTNPAVVVENSPALPATPESSPSAPASVPAPARTSLPKPGDHYSRPEPAPGRVESRTVPQPEQPRATTALPPAQQPSRAAAPVQTASSAAPASLLPRASATASSAGGRPSAPTTSSAMAAPKAAAPPVSSATLTQRLGTPAMTKEQEAEYDSNGRRYPRLLRRTAANGQNTLMANAEPANVPGGASGISNARPVGTVRSTSLGVMASNLVYSPAAAYPPAASAAHVQGAVKLEAVVDPAGNVSAARVISGPPLLRDAALNAIQQWRYKPLISGGKAKSFTTEALMEFQLP